jgi:hypothetical protein
MAKRRGNAATFRRLEQLPALLAERVLPGAARVGAKVIAEEAKSLLGKRRRREGPDRRLGESAGTEA